MPASPHPDQSVPHRPCTPRSLCRRWRQCPRCGAIRQAQLADLAERLATLYPEPYWTVLRPINPAAAAIAAERQRWAALTGTPVAIWTVERSDRSAGLHLNLIHPPHAPVKIKTAHLWSQPITGNVRHVAAYIIDPRKAPNPEAWTGRQHGTIGPLWYILARATQFPAVQALALQYALNPTPPQTAATLARSIERAEPSLSPHEYKQIAARYLPDLMRFAQLGREKSRPE